MQQREIHTLSNGLRVVAEQSSGNVAYIGALTNAGSRDDAAGLDGLAHFVEHTIFKGTASRTSWQISNRMESVGGELNAYTTKEEIMLYTNAPSGYEERAIELLADLATDAAFPETEINRERGVILEEIHSYRDNASYAVMDEFDELFFKGSPLAHNILGYADTVAKIGGNDARDFLKRYFVPENMVLYCVSPRPIDMNLRQIEKRFGTLAAGCRNQRSGNGPEVLPPFDETRNRDNHQANVMMGTRLFSASDPRRYAVFLLSNLLGGSSMNSILNRELRDRRGLVYTVESMVSLYSDAGSFQIYFGCEPANVNKCSRIVTREIERLAEAPMSQQRLTRAQRQLCGQLLVSSDHRESCAMGYAKSLMRHGCVIDNREVARHIIELTPSDVHETARIVAEKPMSRLILI